MLIFEKISNKHILYLIAFLSFFVSIIYKIGSFPITRWDEARLAISAIEMMETKNIFVPTYMFEADHWSTKPFLLVFLQYLSFEVFGVSEFAFRFPSILANIGVVILLLIFSRNVLHDIKIGLLSIIVLYSLPGFNLIHISRTGDYEPLLVFFQTLYVLNLITYLKKEEEINLYWTALGIIGAILTKGIGGGIMLFAISLSVLVFKKYRKKINLKMILLVIIPTLISFLYYPIRNIVDPGYFVKVIENEVLGRFNNSIEGHKAPIYFYAFRLISYNWAWLLVLIYFSISKLFTLIDKTLITLLIVFLTVISLSETKLIWYMAPIYPFLALLIGGKISSIYEKAEFKRQNVVILIAILHIAYNMYKNDNIENKILSYKDYQLTELFYKKPAFLSNKTIIEHGYYPQNLFYAKKCKIDGIKVEYINEIQNLSFKHLIVYQEEVIRKIKNKHTVLREKDHGKFKELTIK